MDDAVTPNSNATVVARSGGPACLGIAAIVVAFLGVSTLLVAGAWWAGTVRGASERAERVEAALAQEVATQIAGAERDIVDGRFELTQRRMAWVLASDPENGTAVALRATADAALAGTATPAPTPSPRPTASPTPNVASTPNLPQLLTDLSRQVEREAWAEALPAILTFQSNYPNYEREVTDRLLYDSYVAYGVELLHTDDVELGLYYLAQAQALGDLPEELSDLRSHARLYLQGLAFFGADWSAAIGYFRDLCFVAPFYQDSCGKLFEALVAFGDQYAGVLDWCPAVRYYREARQYGRSSALNEKVSLATEGCLQATPTPLPTPDVPLTNTVPITTNAPIFGPP